MLAPWRRLLAFVALLILAAAALELVPPLVLKRLIDGHLAAGEPGGLLPLALLYLGATVAVEAIGFLYAYLTAVAAQGALHRLRVQLFAHLQALPLAYFDRTPLGDVISRCTADVEAVDTLFSAGVTRVLGDTVRLVTAAVAMVLVSPPLALVAALTVPPLVLVTNVFRIGVRDAERANRRAVGLLNTHLQEALGGVEVIRAFAREGAFVARFRQALRQALAAFNRATVYAALYPPAMATLAALATALLLWAGTRGGPPATPATPTGGFPVPTLGWGVSLGTLTAFVLLFQRFFRPVTALGEEWQTVQAALSGLERIYQVLGLPAEALPADDGAIRSTSRVPIAVDHVSFGYLPDRPVVRGVTFAVAPGEHVALVGRTGAGKTSLLHLLAGLYAPWSGSVRVMGVDPRALASDVRRAVIGVVPQVVQLFSDTVRENLRLADAAVPEAALRRATRLAGAAAFVEALPDGYDTPLTGSGRGAGTQLSAGQRQLLALARALVWDPHVVLLDEATAAIDGPSEAAFRAALREGVLSRGGAVVSIAHRLSTAREADRVLVLEAGQLVEEGAPEALVQRGGRFAALVDLEAAGWEWQHDVLKV